MEDVGAVLNVETHQILRCVRIAVVRFGTNGNGDNAAGGCSGDQIKGFMDVKSDLPFNFSEDWRE